MEREEVRKAILDALARGANVLLVAPTGWGKTTLAAEIARELASKGRGVVYTTPTLTLAQQKVWSLLRDANSVILTGGATAPGMCPRGHRWYPQKFCRKCELKKNYNFEVPLRISFEELVSLLPDDVCPYWVQRGIEQRFIIRIGHFGRIKNLYKPGDLVIIDEFHEVFQPIITEIDLADFGLETIEDVAVLKERVEEMIAKTSNEEEFERLAYLYDALLKPAVWLEEGKLYAAEVRELDLNPQPQLFAITATPPPEFLRSPPAGWEIFRITAEKKPIAYLYDECFFYDRYTSYKGDEWLARATRPLYDFVIKKIEKGEIQEIAIFAISSLRFYLSYTPLSDLIQRGFAKLYDAWGKNRVGVDLDEDGSLTFWPSFNVALRRAMRARGMDPARAELINAVQLAGRVRRPDRLTIFADCRFKKYKDYLSEFYELEELPSS
ncbi:MAG: hypothetical protein QXU93_07970 [Thermoproteus sp.]